MLLIRPVRLDDLAGLMDLVGEAQFGLTTLPPDAAVLERRIRRSLRSFAEQADSPGGEVYLFVLEDDGQVIGTCGIVSRTGGFDPFWAYRRETVLHRSADLGISREHQLLILVSQHSGPSEIGSLFLSPERRTSGAGRLLSLSRFLFMADHRHLFERDVIAELRGVVDREGRSPFWDAVGRHFFAMDYPDADFLSVRDKRFIGELMPRHPIYEVLLPEAARAVIGVVHPDTAPALTLLRSEGFQPNGLVDIFEAGPVVACPVDEIEVIRRSRFLRVTAIVDDEQVQGTPQLISNRNFDYRATLAPLQCGLEGCRIGRRVAAALGVEVGMAVLAAHPRPDPS